MPENPDFGTFGRYQELLVEEMSPSQKKAYEYTMKERGQVPGPYKIWLQNPKLIEVMVPLGAYYQGHSSLSKAEIEIATNLTNAKWLAGYSNYEHEIIGEQDGGLQPEKVQALIAGLPTSFEDARQQVVYEVTFALLAPRVVPSGLYRRAISLLGDEGLTDLTVLIGRVSAQEEFLAVLDKELTEEGVSIIDVPVDYSHSTDIGAQLHEGVFE